MCASVITEHHWNWMLLSTKRQERQIKIAQTVHYWRSWNAFHGWTWKIPIHLRITSSGKPFIIGVIYRHPAHAFPPFQDEFIKLVTHLQNKNCEYLIGGDFNCNLLKYHEQSNVTNFVDSLASCGCISLINKPTRFSNNCTPYLLDHIYTNIYVMKKKIIMLELLFMIFLIICQFL